MEATNISTQIDRLAAQIARLLRETRHTSVIVSLEDVADTCPLTIEVEAPTA